jgi:hypothetical protein
LDKNEFSTFGTAVSPRRGAGLKFGGGETFSFGAPDAAPKGMGKAEAEKSAAVGLAPLETGKIGSPKVGSFKLDKNEFSTFGTAVSPRRGAGLKFGGGETFSFGAPDAAPKGMGKADAQKAKSEEKTTPNFAHPNANEDGSADESDGTASPPLTDIFSGTGAGFSGEKFVPTPGKLCSGVRSAFAQLAEESADVELTPNTRTIRMLKRLPRPR